MALGSTHPLTEMSKMLRADDLNTFMCRLSWNQLSGTLRACTGSALPSYWNLSEKTYSCRI